MSSKGAAIRVKNLAKRYEVYSRPIDRLKQFLFPRLRAILGRAPAQYFQEFWALKDISFEVKRGETIGIIGRNGSGKSTLLQMICGILYPTCGDIEVHGRIAALLELGSGFNPEFTGHENVYLNASIFGLSNEEIDIRFNAIVDFADIGEFIEQPVKTYSSGMIVRLAFAVIAHVDADILVIDEALAVGDAFFTQKCMRFLRMFMENGTVLFVSHDTGAVRSLCTRALWIDKGVVVREGIPKEVCDSYLEAFFETQQGASLSPNFIMNTSDQSTYFRKDQRQDFINNSNLRNDIKVFDFDPNAASFGRGGAQIIEVILLDINREPLSWIIGGEEAIIKITAKTHEQLISPIIGFHLKDRLGQPLFGDNTYISYLREPLACSIGDLLEAEFHFSMPRLALGDYSISAAIASGTQEDHIHHHWIHDAVYLRSEASSVASGLIGILVTKIELKINNQKNA